SARSEVHAVFVPLGEDVPRKAFQLDDATLLMQVMLEHCDISFTVVDREGVFVLQDGKSLTKSGKRRNYEVGQSIFDNYGADLPEQMAMIRKTLNTGEVCSWIVDYQNILWHVVCMPLRDENGAVRGALLHTIDKSDMKQAMHDTKAKLE